ncbi:MAG: amino acid ABC transporter ATP-binding protein [Candidatus Hadarchaeum sp.]|uniref:amino acid ABC transporter ATP-binding protein n=1 Tax=Candidatus Hadarchaeum sp. TaxID=2883567 RepID=UPI003177896F
MKSEPILELRDLHKYFGSLHVLKSVSFEVLPQEVVAIIGPSGCGKSTCLRCINGLELPDKGQVVFKGQVVNFRRRQERIEIKKHIGIVFQSYNLFPHMTVEENITLGPRKVLGLSRKDALTRAHALLERFGLLDKARAFPDQLSGGQQQRVAIIRTLAMKPDILLLDEVTSALDPELTAEVLFLLEELAEEGMTMVIVSHEMAFIRRTADRVIFMEEGRILVNAPTADVFNTSNERVRRFISALES